MGAGFSKFKCVGLLVFGVEGREGKEGEYRGSDVVGVGAGAGATPSPGL